MVVAELEAHLTEVGYAVETIDGADGRKYLLIKDVQISGGSLAGKACEVAVFYSTADPWVAEAAIHVRPALVAMGQHATQPSPVGNGWQYWSRRFDRAPSPRGFLAHILTVLGEIA